MHAKGKMKEGQKNVKIKATCKANNPAQRYGQPRVTIVAEGHHSDLQQSEEMGPEAAPGRVLQRSCLQ